MISHLIFDDSGNKLFAIRSVIQHEFEYLIEFLCCLYLLFVVRAWSLFRSKIKRKIFQRTKRQLTGKLFAMQSFELELRVKGECNLLDLT